METLSFIPDQSKSRKQNYDDYIASATWAVRRVKALDRAGHRCQLCSWPGSLNVHHNTYERLFNEADADLCVLCRRCHKKFHGIADAEIKKEWKKKPIKEPASPIIRANPVDVGTDPKNIITVTVTAEYIAKLMKPPGGISNRGLWLIGETFPPITGWKERALGRVLQVDRGILEHEIIAAGRRRQNIIDKVVKLQTPSILTDKIRSDIERQVRNGRNNTQIKNMLNYRKSMIRQVRREMTSA